MSLAVEQWIEKLRLEPHPEGGFFKENYRSDLVMHEPALPDSFTGDRNVCTSIYYLLEAGDFSAFHRIKSDELWHFYDGEALELFILSKAGELEVLRLGRGDGETLFAVVPAGCWFASRPAEKASYSLVGCTVAPGFDFADFEMADRADLLRLHPGLKELIKLLTRN